MPANFHPSMSLVAVGKALPRTNTRNQHPGCNEEGCSLAATLSLEYGTKGKSGFLDLCDKHAIKFLNEHPHRASELLVALAKTQAR